MSIPRPENDTYDSHARQCDPNDLWTQVKRTVNGKPLPPEQITLIIDTVASLLELSAPDILLDLCCGNGALTHHWFKACAGGVGVDASPYLIGIANKRFASEPAARFVVAEALAHIRDPAARTDFSKTVCYGSLQYFSRSRAGELLSALRNHYAYLRRVVVGNIPDRDRAERFFTEGLPDEPVLTSPSSPVGVWYTTQDFSMLAAQAGWHCRIHRMPAGFHAAHYRFDAILTPLQERDG
jgi:cyclopropane fatty-acyl-phospholipid synthase-like methyltransferase